MNDALQKLQEAAVMSLQTHPVLVAELTGVYDGPPSRAAFPYISIADAIVSDWSTKTATGREVRLALTLWDDGGNASSLADLMGHAEDAVAAIPRDLPGWRIASIAFLRSMVARDAAGPWAGLLEFRVRMLAAD